MKKLVVDMGLNNLHEEMKMSLMEVASTSTHIGTTFVTYPFVFTFEITIGRGSSRCHTWT
jgi:hypothetical protein